MLTVSDECTLHALLEKIAQRSSNFLGFPVAKDFDYLQLMPFLQYPLNNLGDPFVESTYGVDTREIEKEVIHFFADLFRAEPDNYWGYVTNGGSEGNLYGLYLARELYPKAMIYYSAATHYSIQKNIHLLNMPSIVIKTQPSGAIDYSDFSATLKLNRHLPAIVLANIGTTMTEARDNVGMLKQILKENAIQQHYIHADGALSGGYSAFLDPKPSFDFQDGSDSIAISGHKFFGAPFPLGLVLVKKNNRDRIAKAIAYIGSSDTTITGSRNGLSPLILWYSIKRWGKEGLKKRVEHSLETAAYAEMELNRIGIEAWRNPNSFTVVFPTPDKAIKQKWQLASEDGMSHIICMPNVMKSQIDEFIRDLTMCAVPGNTRDSFVSERGGCVI